MSETTVDRAERRETARELYRTLDLTPCGNWRVPPRTVNGARPIQTGSPMHYFLAPDGRIYGHRAPDSLIAGRIGLREHGPGTVLLGFATFHPASDYTDRPAMFSMNGHLEVL